MSGPNSTYDYELEDSQAQALQDKHDAERMMRFITRIREPLQKENEALKTRILRLEERIAELMMEQK